MSTRAPIGYVSETTVPMAFNQGCRGLAPHTDQHVRYFRYALVALAKQLEAAGQGSTFIELSGDQLAQQPVSYPPLDEQRAIAGFLDSETARLDALITKKRRMIELLEQRQAATIEAAIRAMAASDGVAPLKRRVSEVTVGIVVTPSKWYSDHGVVALRGLNVQPGAIDTTDVVRLTEEGHRLHRKTALRAGDVVVVRTGQAGAAAVVPPLLAGANCIDLLLVRPGVMDAEFLSFVLNSDWTQKHISNHSVGSIQAHFNVAALRELPVPMSSVQEQRSTANRLGEQVREIELLQSKAERQIGLLHEHRRALVTAAVTGELDVPGVAA